jgi:hypothetical protein
LEIAADGLMALYDTEGRVIDKLLTTSVSDLSIVWRPDEKPPLCDH